MRRQGVDEIDTAVRLALREMDLPVPARLRRTDGSYYGLQDGDLSAEYFADRPMLITLDSSGRPVVMAVEHDIVRCNLETYLTELYRPLSVTLNPPSNTMESRLYIISPKTSRVSPSTSRSPQYRDRSSPKQPLSQTLSRNRDAISDSPTSGAYARALNELSLSGRLRPE